MTAQNIIDWTTTYLLEYKTDTCIETDWKDRSLLQAHSPAYLKAFSSCPRGGSRAVIKSRHSEARISD